LRFEADEPVGAQLTAPQPLRIGASVPASRVAACLGLAEADILTGRHAPLVASVGTTFLVAELRDRAALRRIRPDAAGFAALPAEGRKLLVYSADADPARLDARMFFTPAGVVEDPATGSANAALAALLAQLSAENDTTLHLRITQGEDMGRPSLLLTEVDKAAGVIAAVRIGGHCVPVMEGLIDA